MPTTGATTWVCAVRVVELLKVPNYWLCLPTSPTSFWVCTTRFFSSPFSPKAWMMCSRVFLERQCYLLWRSTAFRGFCSGTHRRQCFVRRCAPLLETWKKEDAVWSWPSCHVFLFCRRRTCRQVLSKMFFFFCHRLSHGHFLRTACFGVVCLFIFYAK